MTASGPARVTASLRELLDEHRHLLDKLDRLERELDSRRRPATVVTLLDELHAELVSHFAHEEEGGYFEEALARAPRLTASAQSLLEEHPTLLQGIETARARASDTTATGDWSALEQSFAAFLAEFERHEHDENRLLLDAFDTDLGAED